MTNSFRIFVGVVPDDIVAHGGYDMIIADTKNKTQKVHSLNIGDNAVVVTLSPDMVIAFEPNNEPPRSVIAHQDFDHVMQGIIERGSVEKIVENNLQIDEKTLDSNQQ